jgi:hypothetical protein
LHERMETPQAKALAIFCRRKKTRTMAGFI